MRLPFIAHCEVSGGPIPADDATGIDVERFIMVDEITTVRRSNVGACLGRLNSLQMVELERRLVVFLGLAR
jgi:mRNA interferase MazF